MIHLRRVHANHTPRADVRKNRRTQAETTEQLRDELDGKRPLLRWPLHQQSNQPEGEH